MARKKTIGVTGATGFVGSVLVEKLLKKNYKVKLFVFEKEKCPFEEVEDCRGDLLTGQGIEKFLEDTDVIVHLAGRVLPPDEEMISGNVLTTYNLVAKLLSSKVKKIIFSSSIAVYGDSNDRVFKETDKCNPNTDYGRSKLSAEKIISKWSEKTEGESVVFRFFSIYGPENRKGVVYNLCKDFIEKGKVTVFGSGLQRRDLVYVDDVVELLELSLMKDLGGIYNVGSGKYHTILDLISILENVSGKKCKVDFKEAESEKVDEILYSIDKLKDGFGWVPNVDIKEGIRRVYEYY